MGVQSVREMSPLTGLNLEPHNGLVIAGETKFDRKKLFLARNPDSQDWESTKTLYLHDDFRMDANIYGNAAVCSLKKG